MSTIVTYMFILMILALLIGFFLGWILRRAAYRDRYEREVDELAFRGEKISQDSSMQKRKLETDITHLKHTKDSIDVEAKKQEEYLDQNNKLNEHIQELNNTKNKIQINIEETEQHINQASLELETLTSHSDEILGYKSDIRKVESKIDTQEATSKNQETKISTMEDEIKDLSFKVRDLEKDVSAIDNQLEDIESKSKDIHNQFETKMSGIKTDVQNSNRKMLNYKYALNYTDEKIAANENIDLDTIDKIIGKNEQKSPFENLIRKLFSKSAKYIKGGK